MSEPRDDAYYEALLMKAVDGLLDAGEERELSAWLEANPDRVQELEDFARLKEVTDRMKERMMADVTIEPFRESPAASAWTWLAFFAIFAGLGAMIVFALEQFLLDPGVPAAVRYGAGAALGGTVALFVRMLWIRLRAVGRDPYEEIDR